MAGLSCGWSGRAQTPFETVVVDGGMLGEHKGINAPGVALPADSLTAKDIEDLGFGVRVGVDFIALSFVRSAADLAVAREQLRDGGCAASAARRETRTTGGRVPRLTRSCRKLMP